MYTICQVDYDWPYFRSDQTSLHNLYFHLAFNLLLFVQASKGHVDFSLWETRMTFKL